MTIRAVLFDVAGVLTPPLRELATPHALASGVDLEAMRVAVLPVLGGIDDGDEPAQRWERGEIDLDAFVALTGEAGDHARVLLDASSPYFLLQDIGPEPRMHAFAAEVKAAGFRTAAVSNVVHEWVPTWRQALPPDGVLDEVVLSCEVGLRKPNPAIFVHACAALGVRPDETLLLDDFGPMVESARSIGLHGVHVEDHGDAIAAARALLGL